MGAVMELSIEEHRRALFGLCYRMTGSAADAEDLVQDTFRRALERPPVDREAPLLPWLLKVATNLCIDALRKRKRERYFGPWLPGPVPTEQIEDDVSPSAEARYGALESASVAFLVALEALDERQRAVIVLRDVLGLSGPETAEALETSAGNVRVILHRAREALRAYDEERRPPTVEVRAKTQEVLRRLMVALAMGDVDATISLLAADIVSVHDAAGEHIAAVRPVRGREKVVELYRNILAHGAIAGWSEERDYNGLPAIAFDLGPGRGRYARRIVISIELDASNRVRALRGVIASRKLHAVRFPGA